jgi:aminopeptidase YwaD
MWIKKNKIGERTLYFCYLFKTSDVRKYAFCFMAMVNCMTTVQAQKAKKGDAQLAANLQQHIQYLADDKLEGRRTGTEGEKLAAAYISDAFSREGLLPKGTAGFYQPFSIDEGREIGAATYLMINNQPLALGKDFFPLVYSADGAAETTTSIAVQEQSAPWFYDIKELMAAAKGNPHFDMTEALIAKIKELNKKGASAVLLYNTTDRADGIEFNGKDRIPALKIPVIYITKAAAKKYLSDPTGILDVKFKTAIGSKVRTGQNVVGYIDNGAATTVVLGAHFDHLGHGEDHNSREVEKPGQIHNGADDNASGTAALIELGRLLKASKARNNNYLFLAFSGEELGLYGSKYFTEHPTVDLLAVNYMVNMDMVGRLNDSSHTITLGGYGTSPAWGGLFDNAKKAGLDKEGLNFKIDSSGTGPSDHTSFYGKGIPVLFYFTGLHPDYHKPTDDYDKINYAGEVKIVKHIASLVESLNKQAGKLAFTKTRETQTGTSARFSVTLGIMPDYTFSGAGVRADGISEGKAAQKAGLQTGDVITVLGVHPITSLEAYMQALGTFKKGDTTTVEYKRAGQVLKATVTF